MNRKQAAFWSGLGLLVAIGAILVFVLPMRDPPAPQPTGGGQSAAAAEQEVLPSHRVEGEEGRIYLGTIDASEAIGRGLVPDGTKSVLQVEEAMRHGQFVWQDDGKTSGPLTVWVDLDRQLVSAFRGGHEIGTSVILYGAEGNDSPTGSFPIMDKREDYHSRTYDAPMPYSLWLTNDGVALHGSDVRWGRATHGCIGVPVDFARRLFDVAEEGDVVRIVRSSEFAPADERSTSATA